MRLYLVADTRLCDGMQEFLFARGLEWIEQGSPTDGERVVEAAGRVCYLSFGERQHRKSNSEYISNLIRQRHDSVLEHASFSLLCDGLSRAITHQIVRHRVGFSYSQLSQQYYDETDASFVEPQGLSRVPELRKEWLDTVRATKSVYRKLSEALQKDATEDGLSSSEKLRLARSVARSVLPSATETVLVITGNARAWRHLLSVRGAVIGDLEMREFCVKALNILSGSAPALFKDFTLKEDTVGSFVTVRRE